MLDVLGGRVAIDLPSRFDHLGEPIEAAMSDKTVLPIPSTGVTVGTFKVPGTDDYIGGAAIVMDDLQPPLTLEAIRNRIEQQRAQQQATAGAKRAAVPRLHRRQP